MDAIYENFRFIMAGRVTWISIYTSFSLSPTTRYGSCMIISESLSLPRTARHHQTVAFVFSLPYRKPWPFQRPPKLRYRIRRVASDLRRSRNRQSFAAPSLYTYRHTIDFPKITRVDWNLEKIESSLPLLLLSTR